MDRRHASRCDLDGVYHSSCRGRADSLSQDSVYLFLSAVPEPFRAHSRRLFGFVAFTEYLPQMEHWSLLNPWQAILFVPLIAAALLGVRQYRKQMLDMDKQLIFEEPSASTF
jgi:hypothetical protein